MSCQLTGDQLRRGHKKLGELHRQLGQREYPFDPERLLAALDALVEGRFEAAGEAFPCQIHARGLIPEGWTVVEDVEPSEFQTLEDLEFIAFLKDGEPPVKGKVMRRRAVELRANLGLSDAQRLMDILNALDKPPDDLQGGYIALTGTVLRGPGGRLGVPCLDGRVDRWYLHFSWLDYGWDGHARLARCKSE